MITAAQAAADLRTLLEGDFSVEILVTDPDESTATISGQFNDVSQSIDPETGTLVGGRRSTVALPIDALIDAGLGVPVNISSSSLKPWRVTFSTPTSTAQTFKIVETRPDALGCVICFLETYKT